MQPGPISLEQACAKLTRFWSPHVARPGSFGAHRSLTRLPFQKETSKKDQHIQAGHFQEQQQGKVGSLPGLHRCLRFGCTGLLAAPIAAACPFPVAIEF